MKSKLLILLPLLLTCTLSAQLTITPGAQLSIDNIQVALNNTDLINNGNFTATNCQVHFTGNATSVIGGNQPIQFFDINVNKANNTSVILQRTIEARNVLFSRGFLNLNSFNADLGTTGSLFNENENSRIVGPNGGQVLLSTVLNGSGTANPGNLGLFVDFPQNLGNVIIRRGHQSQSGTGLPNSILRYYDVAPANNAILDQLQINYFDAELNGIQENSLVFFKSDNLIDWSNQGSDSRSANGNFVSKNNIASFSRWTLSVVNNPLPVLFILFNVKCEDNKVLVTWKTAQEQNSSHFNIERSNDGTRWTVIGNLPAAGNSPNENSYSFTDNSPVENGFYRIAQYDLDGKVQYTSILRSTCTIADAFRLWPNPVHNKIFINIVSGNASQAAITIFDSKGALVKIQKATILRGSNQLSVDMASFANGIYSVSVDWNSGQIKKTVQVMKQ